MSKIGAPPVEIDAASELEAKFALLDKRARRLVDADLRYVGFEAPDAFYVGYGLDFRQRYRNLPYIGVLRPELTAR